ncbi:MAG: hypothetical protein IT206_00730 [Fimbriimonadaceae bacterium]|nr:hypothetical protein [Fimbriimonadaceae bacterium]
MIKHKEPEGVAFELSSTRTKPTPPVVQEELAAAWVDQRLVAGAGDLLVARRGTAAVSPG